LVALWVGPMMTLGRLEFAALASLYLFAGTLLEEHNLRQELGDVYDVYAALLYRNDHPDEIAEAIEEDGRIAERIQRDREEFLKRSPAR